MRSFFLSVDLDAHIYNFWEYRFTRQDDYGSIELERCARFTIKERPRDDRMLDHVSTDRVLLDIPQADNVDTICVIPYLISMGSDASESLARQIGFTPRQALYYTQAAEQLGLVERKKGTRVGLRFVLTDLGQKVVKARPDRRHEIIAEQMMRLPIMREVFDELKLRDLKGERTGLSREDVAGIITRCSELNLTTSHGEQGPSAPGSHGCPCIMALLN